MHTMVSDGEPVVYGDVYPGHEFCSFMHSATGEWKNTERWDKIHEQISALHRAVRMEGYEKTELLHKRMPANITQRVFQFVADECCNEDKHADTTIHVMKKSKWGSHMGWTRVRGCRCRKCGDDPHLSGSVAFLNEVGHVSFEI